MLGIVMTFTPHVNCSIADWPAALLPNATANNVFGAIPATTSRRIAKQDEIDAVGHARLLLVPHTTDQTLAPLISDVELELWRRSRLLRTGSFDQHFAQRICRLER